MPDVWVVHLHTMKFVQTHQGWNRADCLLLFTGLASWNQHPARPTLNQRFLLVPEIGWKRSPPLVETWSYRGVTAPLTFAKNTSSAAYIRPQKIIDGSFRKVVVVGGPPKKDYL